MRLVAVEGDHALTDAVQHRFALLHQRGDLIELQPERAALEPPSQRSEATIADAQRDRDVKEQRRKLVEQLVRDLRSRGCPRRPRRSHAVGARRRHLARWPRSRGCRDRPRGASRPSSATTGSLTLLADQRRIRVREADSVGFDDDDVGRAGLVPDLLRERLDLTAVGGVAADSASRIVGIAANVCAITSARAGTRAPDRLGGSACRARSRPRSSRRGSRQSWPECD